MPKSTDTELSPEAQAFLAKIYAKYSTDPTDEQKYEILRLELDGGNSGITRTYSHNPTWAQKKGMLELEILDKEGLIELVLA